MDWNETKKKKPPIENVDGMKISGAVLIDDPSMDRSSIAHWVDIGRAAGWFETEGGEWPIEATYWRPLPVRAWQQLGQ